MASSSSSSSASNTEVDPILRYAIKLMHSSQPDAAEKIRLLIDDAMRKFDPNAKTLTSQLSKVQLAEEWLATGSNMPAGEKQPEEHSAHSSRSSSVAGETGGTVKETQQPGHVTTVTLDSGNSGPDGGLDGSGVEGMYGTVVDGQLVIDSTDDNEYDAHSMTDLEDLTCQVCRRMDVSARNRLTECVECHALYHQECHKPPISEADANEHEFSWCCSECSDKRMDTTPVTTIVSTVANPAISILGLSSSPVKSSSSSSSPSSSSHQQQHYAMKASTSSAAVAGPSSSLKHSKLHQQPQQLTFEAALQQASIVTPSMPLLGNMPSTSAALHHREHSSSHHHHKSGKSSSSSKHHHSSSSSSSSSARSSKDRADRSEAGPSTTSKPSLTPNINIISADKRLQNMKKKAAKMQQESRRKK